MDENVVWPCKRDQSLSLSVLFHQDSAVEKYEIWGYISVRSISAGRDSKVHQTFQKDLPPILYFSCRAARSLPVLDPRSSSEQKISIRNKNPKREGEEKGVDT